MREPGLVYFIRVGEQPFVKIGYTDRLHHRLAVLQTGHWEAVWLALVMPGDRALERELHARFNNWRHMGEWFKLSEPIDRFIRASESAHADLRAQYAWHCPMSEDDLDAVLAKLNPELFA